MCSCGAKTLIPVSIQSIAQAITACCHGHATKWFGSSPSSSLFYHSSIECPKLHNKEHYLSTKQNANWTKDAKTFSCVPERWKHFDLGRILCKSFADGLRQQDELTLFKPVLEDLEGLFVNSWHRHIHFLPEMSWKGFLNHWMQLRSLSQSDGLGSWPLPQRFLHIWREDKDKDVKVQVLIKSHHISHFLCKASNMET